MKQPLVVERISRRAPSLEPETLPPVLLDALRSIVRDMRDVPRDCLYDQAELVHWLNRMARRVEGVATMEAPIPPRIARRPPALAAAPARALTVKQQAEAVFDTAPKSNTKAVDRRTVVSRKGQTVRVEIRNACAASQMDFGV